jgi:hypothetical protein
MMGGFHGKRSFHGKQRGPMDLGQSSIELVDDFPIARASSDRRACEFDFSVSKNKIRCAG